MIDVSVPQLGESVSEGTIGKWLVKEGDVVTKDQALAEIATDKADSELPSPVDGRVAKLLAKEGDVVPVRTVICQIEEGVTAAAAPAPARPATPPPPPGPAAAAPGASRSAAGGALASPGARKAALERSVSLDGVRGSGERGRITKEDVLRLAEAPPRTEPPMSPSL
ncbi:MAG: E3 binding domain-containing protein, partial [Myxococcales bacterium]|nr:E3 binding domain-containing protein [Myxococcales bacterium]